jgi:hypothetical protein
MSVYLTACKSGDPGPKGDTGAAGTVGATGPAGPVGATGPSSVTQVTYATPFTLVNDGGKPYLMPLPSYITKAVIDKSLVVVYMQFAEAGTQVYQIPGIIPVFGDEFSYTAYTASPTVQNVAIYRITGSYFKTVTQVRVLIIPAATVINGRKAAINYANYAEVKAYYNLPD